MPTGTTAFGTLTAELYDRYPSIGPFDERVSRLGEAIGERAAARAFELPSALFALFLDLLSVFVISTLLVTNRERILAAILELVHPAAPAEDTGGTGVDVDADRQLPSREADRDGDRRRDHVWRPASDRGPVCASPRDRCRPGRGHPPRWAVACPDPLARDRRFRGSCHIWAHLRGFRRDREPEGLS